MCRRRGRPLTRRFPPLRASPLSDGCLLSPDGAWHLCLSAVFFVTAQFIETQKEQRAKTKRQRDATRKILAGSERGSSQG